MSDQLSGTIDRVTFHNPENGFVVLRVVARGVRGPVTVVGQTPRAVAGEFVEATGKWADDPDFGRQFKADGLRILPPSTLEGIEKYLGSGLVKGIGPTYARKIVEVFGERTLDVIDESPTFLKEIKGIGAKRIQCIRESWRQQKAVRDIMVFLQSNGLGTGHASRIYKTYGERAMEIVKSNPYRLADDVWGIGFQTADELALKLGFDRQAVPRAQAAVRYILQEASGDGHCALPEETVWQEAAQRTGIDLPILQDATTRLVDCHDLVRETDLTPTPWLYLHRLHQAETGVARALRDLMRGTHPLPTVHLDAAIEWIEKKMNLTLAPSQKDAIGQAVAHKVLVLTGGPGVGKTTLVRGILDIFLAKKLRAALCAPTGRAAKRLSETTGQSARTIHRLLEFDQRGPQRNADHPLEVDFLIVDETSMVDIVLMNQLLRALPWTAALLLVGDADQLPSVGPGCVLADIIASKAVPVVRLTEIFRQARESGIVRAAYRIHDGEMPESDAPHPQGESEERRLGDFYFVEAEAPAAILERVVTLIRERIPRRFHLDPFRDVQVLTPMNRGELGVKNLNVRLQSVLNPPEAQEGPEVARFGWSFRVGDKVLQMRNNYTKEIFNGDVGRIRSIDVDDQELTVDFDGRAVGYDFDELDELTLAYALTIHKSQGSEYPAVIVPLHTQHYLLLQRNLLYTAVTRGRKLVVLVGTRKALALAVQRHNPGERHSALRQRLQA
ncbi:MAG: ATP-dependent RecD-like DNA helicase [Planctomycetes bacterium]|nr:ATP-dependent RecD-like DNA helicase [Planctomycetota bacterium]